jgi:hypothetical protein
MRLAAYWLYLVLALQAAVILLLVFWPGRRKLRLRIFVSTKSGGWLVAQPITVADTHAPLQLRADYVNAKGKVVPPPAGAAPIQWSVSDAALATDAPSGSTDVVTLAGPDGSFTVGATDGTFSDSLPVTVTPDQTATGLAISVDNP